VGVRAWVLKRLLRVPPEAEILVKLYLGWGDLWDDLRNQTGQQMERAGLPLS
jgi:hypothetical protein